MTREIKFRAWNIKEKRRADHNELLSDISVVASVLTPSTISICDDRYETMKFTGLYDKNNQPIFEGDILKFHNGFCEDDSEVVRYNTGGRGLEDCEVFLHELFIWKDESNKYLGKHLDVEIIGNPYEHPHLLTNDQGN